MQSITITRFVTPTCGAASPMPGAAYIVSSMSAPSRLTSSVISVTGSQTFLRRGSGWIRMGRIMPLK